MSSNSDLIFENSNEPELNEEIHTHAGLLYQELEVLVQMYGQDVISNLLPHIIQVTICFIFNLSA